MVVLVEVDVVVDVGGSVEVVDAPTTVVVVVVEEVAVVVVEVVVVVVLVVVVGVIRSAGGCMARARIVRSWVRRKALSDPSVATYACSTGFVHFTDDAHELVGNAGVCSFAFSGTEVMKAV